MRSILFFTLFLVVQATAQIKVGVPVSGKKTDKTLAALDKLFASSVASFNVPGMAVAIVQDDQLIFSKGYGVANVSTNDPVTDETVFAIASNPDSGSSSATRTSSSSPPGKSFPQSRASRGTTISPNNSSLRSA
jgi:hypothetical protein